MGDARNLWIPGPVGRLEAALRMSEAPRALAVVAHPHPDHGGTLHNPVVFHTERELNRAGLTTLRFNFRGVGTSEGAHDSGRGEVADAAAAVNWTAGLSRTLPLLIVGYSFGAWCGGRHAVDDSRVAGFVAIGLPVTHYDFEFLRRFSRPVAVIQGSDDEFGSPDEVRELLGALRPAGELFVIDGAPHRLGGRAGEVASAVTTAAGKLLDHLDRTPPRPRPD